MGWRTKAKKSCTFPHKTVCACSCACVCFTERAAFINTRLFSNSSICVLVLLRKLSAFPTWQQRQGKAGRDPALDTTQTPLSKSKRGTHPGRKWERADSWGSSGRGADAQGQRHADGENWDAEAGGGIFKARADEKKEGERTIKKSSHHLLPQREMRRSDDSREAAGDLQWDANSPTWTVSDCYFMDCVRVCACVSVIPVWGEVFGLLRMHFCLAFTFHGWSLRLPFCRCFQIFLSLFHQTSSSSSESHCIWNRKRGSNQCTWQSSYSSVCGTSFISKWDFMIQMLTAGSELWFLCHLAFFLNFLPVTSLKSNDSVQVTFVLTKLRSHPSTSRYAFSWKILILVLQPVWVNLLPGKITEAGETAQTQIY